MRKLLPRGTQMTMTLLRLIVRVLRTTVFSFYWVRVTVHENNKEV